ISNTAAKNVASTDDVETLATDVTCYNTATPAGAEVATAKTVATPSQKEAAINVVVMPPQSHDVPVHPELCCRNLFQLALPGKPPDLA
ncbi:hypothetical protein GOP47_0031239, partial [Adiantum capillus-veneris]